MKPLHLIHTQGLPIFEQLQLEEALLRADEGFWCLINQGSSPAVVMGISGTHNGLHIDQLHDLPVIKRFSGGGTVVVDDNTLFVTFLGPHAVLPCSPFPEPIMQWSTSLYTQAFGIPQFGLRENDYVIGDLKCGGNAQYLRKERWLHHTSFLWDYCPNRMNALKLPTRRPQYRGERTHEAFLTPLCHHLPSKAHFQRILIQVLKAHFAVTPVALSDAQAVLERPHRRATCLHTL